MEFWPINMKYTNILLEGLWKTTEIFHDSWCSSWNTDWIPTRNKL